MRFIRLTLISLLIGTIFAPLNARPIVKKSRPDVSPTQLQKMQKNIGLDGTDTRLKAAYIQTLGELIRLKEPKAPVQPVPARAIFVTWDKNSFLFTPTLITWSTGATPMIRFYCHGWFREAWDWSVFVEVSASKREDWDRVSDLYQATQADRDSFWLDCQNAKVETDYKLKYLFLRIDLSEPAQDATFSAPNYLVDLDF